MAWRYGLVLNSPNEEQLVFLLVHLKYLLIFSRKIIQNICFSLNKLATEMTYFTPCSIYIIWISLSHLDIMI